MAIFGVYVNLPGCILLKKQKQMADKQTERIQAIPVDQSVDGVNLELEKNIQVGKFT